MLSKRFILTVVISLSAINAYAERKPQSNDAKIYQLLNKHFESFRNVEYFSGISLSIYIPNHEIQNYYIGTTSHENGSNKIDKNTLFQIGSITKSFTAALMLQLENDGKMDLNTSLKDWLPEYSKWSGVKLNQLLNMTSGLPNYTDTPLWNARIYNEQTHIWQNKELLSYVYPDGPLSPPLQSGYFYTNTGYILANLIINKVVNDSFKDEIENRLFKAAGLTNTFYPIPQATPDITKRMASGYNYNQYDNPALVGKNISTQSLSWAGAAGGIVSNSEDIIKWVKALFIDDKILNSKQKNKLMQLVSTETGEPIQKTSENDPGGFALGITQKYSKNPYIGNFWFYEGETLGFRAIYMYTPCNNVIISSIFNSATNSKNDHSRELMQSAYRTLIKHNPKLACLPQENGQI